MLGRTNFSPKCCGANSTERTVPLASTSMARSTNLVEHEPPAPVPLSWPPSRSGAETCSQTLTVRSKEAVARTVPNSGCAQLSFETTASWA